MEPHFRVVDNLKQCPFVIGNLICGKPIGFLPGLHQFQRIPGIKPVLQAENRMPFPIRFVQQPNDLPIPDILAVFIILPIFFFAELKHGIVIAMADLADLIKEIFGKNVRLCIERINCTAVCAGHAGRIICRFIPPLNLK